MGSQVMMLEIAFHFPPPFRFSSHWDIKRSGRWNAEQLGQNAGDVCRIHRRHLDTDATHTAFSMQLSAAQDWKTAHESLPGVIFLSEE